MTIQKRKYFVLCILCLFVVLLASCIWMPRPDYTKIENIHCQIEPQLGMHPFSSNQYCVLQNGNCFAINDEQQLWYYQNDEWTKVSPLAKYMMPLPDGVVYFGVQKEDIYKGDSYGTYYAEAENTILLAENVDSFCGDGERVFYYDVLQKQVVSFDGEKTQVYFDIPEIKDSNQPVRHMLANDNWILLSTGKGVYQYNRKTEEVAFNAIDEFQGVVGGLSMLYDNKLASFSPDSGRLDVFDLVTGEKAYLKLYDSCETVDAEISCALHGDHVYLSVYNFELWGTKADEYTLKIHRGTDEIDIINDEYYENLLCTDTALYGGKIHRMTKICEFE